MYGNGINELVNEEFAASNVFVEQVLFVFCAITRAADRRVNCIKS